MRYTLLCILLVGMLLTLVLPVLGQENLTVSRRILLPDGKPAAGAKVTIRTIGMGGELMQEIATQAGPDGMVNATYRGFRMQRGQLDGPVSPGFMIVDVPGCALAFGKLTTSAGQGTGNTANGVPTLGWAPKDGGGGGGNNDGSLRLSPAYEQSGVVVEKGTGKPIPGAVAIVVGLMDRVPVNVFSLKYITQALAATADAQGKFKLRGVTAEALGNDGGPYMPGSYPAAMVAYATVNNRTLGGESKVFSFSPTPREALQKIEIGPTVPLEGKVVNSATGAPVAGARVVLEGMPTIWVSCLDAVITDANGIYRFPAMPAMNRIYALATRNEFIGGVVQALEGGGMPAKIVAPDMAIHPLGPVTTFLVVDEQTGRPPQVALRMGLLVERGYSDEQLGWIGTQEIFAPVQPDGTVSARMPLGENPVRIFGQGYEGEGIVTVPARERVIVKVKRSND